MVRHQVWRVLHVRCSRSPAEFPYDVGEVSVRRRRIAVAIVLTLVAGAGSVVLALSLASDDSVSDKPRPPMIILTRLDDNGGGENGE